ncbi:MAG: hypothetical protein RLY20_2721, partial [Verrucomicrobiota bacterium]
MEAAIVRWSGPIEALGVPKQDAS